MLGTILAIFKYHNDLSNEVLLLIIVLIGGFLFHTIWEAKSRYIISYILVLIPVASISIGKLELKGKELFKKGKKKNER